MLEPPRIAEGRVVAAVRRSYGLDLTQLAFLPLGHDVQAWAYRGVTADGGAYFLKLRRGVANPVALRVARALADQGATHVVAPLPTRTGRLWDEAAGFSLMLYPFIEGVTGMANGLNEGHWVTFGAALKQIHEMTLPPDVVRDVPCEAFTLAHLFQRQRQTPWADVVAALESLSARQNVADPSARELAAFWQEKRAEIQALVDRFATLGQQLRATDPPFVLCHADAHLNNVLIDMDDQLWIVDWDEILLAPKECDLMMGVGGLGLGSYPAGPQAAAWFLRGYGSADLNPVALTYYRHARALGDIGADADEALQPSSSEAAKLAALQWLLRLFAPGNIVSLATRQERFGA